MQASHRIDSPPVRGLVTEQQRGQARVQPRADRVEQVLVVHPPHEPAVTFGEQGSCWTASVEALEPDGCRRTRLAQVGHTSGLSELGYNRVLERDRAARHPCGGRSFRTLERASHDGPPTGAAHRRRRPHGVRVRLRRVAVAVAVQHLRGGGGPFSHGSGPFGPACCRAFGGSSAHRALAPVGAWEARSCGARCWAGSSLPTDRSRS